LIQWKNQLKKPESAESKSNGNRGKLLNSSEDYLLKTLSNLLFVSIFFIVQTSGAATAGTPQASGAPVFAPSVEAGKSTLTVEQYAKLIRGFLPEEDKAWWDSETKALLLF
jgi:hypothetical protein